MLFSAFIRNCIELSLTVNIDKEEIITILYVAYDFSEMK